MFTTKWQPANGPSCFAPRTGCYALNGWDSLLTVADGTDWTVSGAD